MHYSIGNKGEPPARGLRGDHERPARGLNLVDEERTEKEEKRESRKEREQAPLPSLSLPLRTPHTHTHHSPHIIHHHTPQHTTTQDQHTTHTPQHTSHTHNHFITQAHDTTTHISFAIKSAISVMSVISCGLDVFGMK